MKRISTTSRKIRYTVLICCFAMSVNWAMAQQNNSYPDGENYITLGSTAFPARVQWTDASKARFWGTASEAPVRTYWFSHHGRSYAVINLTTGKNEIYVELGDNKKAYQFPQDYTHSRQAGTYNNFKLYVENKLGVVQVLSATKGSRLLLNVVQVDSLHLKSSFSGTIVPYSNPAGTSGMAVGDPLSPISISGKISLTKKTAGLPHLPDTYSGCDNTIYNEISPDFSTGQYYTPTECEQSFYRKTYDALSIALSPVFKYLSEQNWDMSNAPKYKPLEQRFWEKRNDFFKVDPISGVDFDLDVHADPAKGPYHEYIQKVMSLAQQLGQGDQNKIKELEILQKEEPEKFKIHLQVFYNQAVQSNYRLDLSHAEVKKLNDEAFIVEGVGNTGEGTFHNDGGTYLFIGKWTTPRLNDDYIVCSPVMRPDLKKLSIQALYIRIGCGKELSETILSHIDTNALFKLLQVTP